MYDARMFKDNARYVIKCTLFFRPNELPSFSLICLWISEAIMWLDNLVLALRHWSVHEPIIVCYTVHIFGL